MSLAITNGRLAFAVWLLASSLGLSLYGAPPVEIQVAIEPGAPITAPQDWAKLLGKLGLARVQIRSARSDDRPQITLSKTARGQRVKVLALLSRSGELVLPDRRFKSHNLAALREYFQELPLNAAEGNDPRGRFDLTDKQFQAVFGDLSKRVDFSTTGITKTKLLRRLSEKFATPLDLNHIAETRLSDPPLIVELRSKSVGFALALVLRQEGLALKPEKPRGEPLQMRVIRYDRAVETWPVGWKSEASPRQLAPKMFEYLNIEIAGYSLIQALDALEPRLGVPVILDQWILKREGIQLDQVQVKLPRGKTYLKKAVDRILSQARLAGELRVDELGQPFYWVTQFGNDSLRAE